MKVLLFIETGGPGGAERVILTLAVSLREAGVDVMVATLREGWLTDSIDRAEINRAVLPSSGKFDLLLGLIRLIRKEKIDLVHSHLLDSNFYSAMACFFTGVPQISTEHGDVHHLEKKSFAGLKIKLISILSRKILSVSSFTRDALIEAGARPEKCVVFPNPLLFPDELEKAPDLKIKRSEKLPERFSDDSIWLWIHVANMRKVKDQATLLHGYAGAKSRSTIPQGLIIIGDGDEMPNLVNLAETLDIKDEVLFLGFRDDTIDLLKLCDGFILSSLSEAMPMALLEASSAGLLLVTTNVGGISELIEDKVTGYLFGAGNKSELSNIIDSVVNDPVHSRNIALSGHAKLKELVHLPIVIERLRKMYRESSGL
ncbi:MAG TPA: glycosyltransferase [Oligoflexia bacterium]|nr:glycosyltransferase [Oligoflexia bacterium]HMP48362.1 glycosyltransferase [Oligoflexia bacterium]